MEVGFNSFSFSDLVVRCTEIGVEPSWFILLMGELHYLAARQVGLAAEGVLLRGAVSMGDLLVDPAESLVFGPALVRSYDLERKQAVYPRIVIDRNLALDANKTFQNAFENLIRRADDGTYFLDYLCGLLTVQFDPPVAADVRERIVRDHRKTIEVALNDTSVRKDESIIQKYRWLALYHNAAVHRLRQRLGVDKFSGGAEFLIPEEALSF